MDDSAKVSTNLCFRSETVKLLGLSVAQIHTSLTEGENSVTTLTDTFKQMFEVTERAKMLVGDNTTDVDESFRFMTEELQGQITAAIVAFQFYDRLSQRLSHVATGLNDISELLSEDNKLFNANLWETVRDGVKENYTMEAEYIMHDAILNGASVEEAIDVYKKRLKELEDEGDDIELF